MIFFISISFKAEIPAINIVMVPKNKRKEEEWVNDKYL